MALLLLLLLVAVALGAAGLLGVGVLSAGSRRRRSGLLAAVSAPVVLLVALAFLAALVLGVDGSGGDHPGDSGAAPEQPAATTPEPVAPPSGPLRWARLNDVRYDYPVVALEPGPADRFVPAYTVGGLAPGGVVRLRVSGFGWFDRAVAEQCVTELDYQTACGPGLAVQLDGDGRADVLFVARGDLAPGGCRAGQATCLLRVREGEREAVAQIVLVDKFVPARVSVTPERGLIEGGTVDVAVEGLPPESRATVVLCAPSPTYDARRCSPSLATFVADAQGSGRTRVALQPGPVGTDRVSCGPRRPCGVMVLAGPGYVVAPAAVVSFAEGPGAGYPARRVVPGVAVGVLLLLVAGAIALRTDWSKPSEAETPEMDEADLGTDLDLDALFGTDEELDARDPVPW